MSRAKAIEMIENIIERHSLCGMRKAELQEVIDELRDEPGNDLRDKIISRESDSDKEHIQQNEVVRAIEALERRVKALEKER